ncbi:MAG TPA: DUF4384 domain-containing protein, partial [Polyangiales bacterium]
GPGPGASMLTRLNGALGALCVSDLRIDQLLADELDATESAALRAHLSHCGACRERFATIDAERAQFISAHPSAPNWLLREPVRAKAARYGVLLLLAAVALLALVRPSAELRTKGGEAFGFYVKRGNQVRRGSLGEPLHPGDRLRFTYSAQRARYLAILSVDSARHTNVYFPAAPDAAQVEPGTERPLPSAIELDAVLGSEQVLAIFCDRPFSLAPLLSRLGRAESSLNLPADCVTDRVTLQKEAPR